MTIYEQARQYAENGWAVFPCGYDRTPLHAGSFYNASTDPAQIREWFEGQDRLTLAISPGHAGLIVVDEDPRHGGDVNMKALVAQYGPLARDTFRVRTGRGGTHTYLRGVGPSTAGAIAGGIDTRSMGGYAIAPPSRGEYGEYSVLSGDIAHIEQCPEWFLNLLHTRHNAVKKGPIPDKFPDGTRNENMLRMLGKARRFGMAHDELLAVGYAINQTRCEPPLSDEEVETLVNRAESYRDNDPAIAADELSVISCADMLASDSVPLNVLVENILPERALVIAAAAPKAGKSTFSIALCHALATGTPFLGKLPVKKSRVLYWIPDDPNVDRFKRTWVEFAGHEPVENFYMSVTHAMLPEAFELIEEAIRKREAQVCIVDAYTRIRGKQSGDFVQQEYSDMRRFSEMALKSNCSIVLIHHHSKSSAGSKNDAHMAAAGSYAMGAGVDAQWSFDRVGDSERKLQVRGRDLDEYSLIYKRGGDHKLRLLVDGDATEHWKDLHAAIENDLPAQFDAKTLANCIGKDPRTGRRTINRWAYAGLIHQVGGVYELTPEIVAALELKPRTPSPDEDSF